MANHFNILASRAPWIAWKGKKWSWGSPIALPRRSSQQLFPSLSTLNIPWFGEGCLGWETVSRPRSAPKEHPFLIQRDTESNLGGDRQVGLLLRFGASVDSDCDHEMKRHLLPRRKVMKNLDSILKSRHHFANKGLKSQSYGFSSSRVQMWELDHKEGWAPKNGCF